MLSEYICSIGYEGYAIKYMPTAFEGTFHPEFMFCDVRGIDYVKKVTSDKRVDEILQTKKLDDLSRQVEEDRKNKRQRRQANNYDDYNNDLGERIKPKLFSMDDDDDEAEMGGAKRSSYKRRKTTRKTRKANKTRNKKKTMKSNRKGKHKKRRI
jgi:hypothetical protein